MRVVDIKYASILTFWIVFSLIINKFILSIDGAISIWMLLSFCCLMCTYKIIKIWQEKREFIQEDENSTIDFNLHLSTIAEIETLAKASGISQAELITQAVKLWQEHNNNQ